MPRTIDPLEELKAYVAQYPTQAAAARALNISEVYLSDILAGRRGVSDPMLEKLGLVRVTTVVKP